MKVETKIQDVCARTATQNPTLTGVLFGEGKIVATDSFKLVEIDAEGSVNAVIDRKLLKKGDNVERDESGKIIITRKDGSKLEPENIADPNYFPKYNDLFEEAEKREHYKTLVSKDLLVELLNAIPDEKLIIEVPKDEDKCVYVHSERSRGMIMPLRQ